MKHSELPDVFSFVLISDMKLYKFEAGIPQFLWWLEFQKLGIWIGS